MASVNLYIFRHGETDWNVERRFQGHTDIPLNSKGRDQALLLRRPLTALAPQLMLTSDLSRAAETAQLVSEGMDIATVSSHQLREAFLGEPEGQLRDEIIKKYGMKSWQCWLSEDPGTLDFCFPGGETKRQHLQRALDFLETQINSRLELKTAAVSTHGGTIRRLVHHCQDAPQEPVIVANCSLYHLQYSRPDHTWHYKGVMGTGAGNENETLFR
jgi:broad specificity phosphatase PhoE